MSIKFPQADLPAGTTGGRDLWDSEAGPILVDEFFGDLVEPPFSARVAWVQFEIPYAAAGGGGIQAWNGTAWVPGTLKRWNGSAWVAATLKRWNGSSWITA